MMINEFIERTKYEPTMDEYNYIEQAYMEFDGNKDEFCKAWLKTKKSGAWETELKLRKRIDELLETALDFKDTIKRTNELLSKYIDDKIELEEKVEELKKELEQKDKEIEYLEALCKTDIKIEFKNGEMVYERVEEIKYFDKDGFKFINVIQENGWIDSYKMDEIAKIEIC